MSADQHAIEATKTLAALESTITKGRQTFIEVGLALMEIRERRLYREAGFPTFEKYCIGRWQFSRQRAHQLVEAANVAKELSAPAAEADDQTSTVVDIPAAEHQAPHVDDETLPIVDVPMPATERQARELAPLVKTDPEQARQVWSGVVEEAEATEQPITAATVRQAVQRATKPERTEPDPRIAELEAALAIIVRCREMQRDVYRVAFHNLVGRMRHTLKDMKHDPRTM